MVRVHRMRKAVHVRLATTRSFKAFFWSTAPVLTQIRLHLPLFASINHHRGDRNRSKAMVHLQMA